MTDLLCRTNSGLTGSLGFLLLTRYLINMRKPNKSFRSCYDIAAAMMGFMVGYTGHEPGYPNLKSKDAGTRLVTALLLTVNILAYYYM